MFVLGGVVILLGFFSVSFAGQVAEVLGSIYLFRTVSLVGVIFIPVGLTLGLYAFLTVYLRHGTFSAGAAVSAINEANAPSLESAQPTRESNTRRVSRGAASVAREDILERNLLNRLRTEIREQGRRANTNLVVGIIAAAIGIALLLWLAIDTSEVASQNTNQINDGYRFWSQFLSKSLMSLACNVFAFFFLSTYRRNLSEIRYFHNEMTNMQAKLIATRLTAAPGLEEVRQKVILDLSAIERNFILKKGELTIDMGAREADRADMDAILGIAKALAGNASLMKPATRPRAPNPSAKAT
jgi:hypothetical protein